MIARQTTRAVSPREGFTLMELLVVVAILVVLAGTGGMIYMAYLDNARRDTARLQVKTTLTQAVEAYNIRYGEYPASLLVLAQMQPDGGKPFLEEHGLVDPWGRPYEYDPQGTNNGGLKPDIWSNGPDGANPIGNWPGQ
jgi:general secretion pathway protein G